MEIHKVVFSLFPLFGPMDKHELHQDSVAAGAVPSNQSEQQEEEEDYFDIMKDNVQETSKQLDVYLTSYHHGRSQISACRVQIVPIAWLCSQWETLQLSRADLYPLKRQARFRELWKPTRFLKLNKKYWWYVHSLCWFLRPDGDWSWNSDDVKSRTPDCDQMVDQIFSFRCD